MEENLVDSWIEQLSQCKQLSEADVKKLCEKVCGTYNLQFAALDSHYHQDARDPHR